MPGDNELHPVYTAFMKMTFLVPLLLLSISSFAHESVEAPLTREDIRAAFRSQLKEVRPCLKTLEKKEAGGKILLDFTVDQTGAVRTAKVNAESTLKKESTQACVLEKIKTWRFPAAPEGKTIAVRYPIVLENTKR